MQLAARSSGSVLRAKLQNVAAGRYSGIRYVSPAQGHAGDDTAILAARHELYVKARERNPRRWSGATRNWTPIEAVTLNPERDSIVKNHSGSVDIQPLAA